MTNSILLVSSGIVHPPLLGRLWLYRALTALPGSAVQVVRSMEALPQTPLHAFAGMVIYLHRQRISDTAVSALTDFVERGGGVLGVHSATASFKESDAYFAVLGGRFTGHGPVERINVQPGPTATAIFGDVRPFPIRDELYRHEHKGDLQVHFFTVQNGEQVPLVWTRQVGNGRVCVVSPGHRSATLRHPAMRQIVQRGVQWVCSN